MKGRQLKRYKGSGKDWDRQKRFGIMDEQQTEKINERVQYAVGLFITVAIGLSLVVGILEMCAFVGEPIGKSATQLTATFEATNGMLHASLPTLLAVLVGVAFFRARHYYRQTDK